MLLVPLLFSTLFRSEAWQNCARKGESERVLTTTPTTVFYTYGKRVGLKSLSTWEGRSLNTHELHAKVGITWFYVCWFIYIHLTHSLPPTRWCIRFLSGFVPKNILIVSYILISVLQQTPEKQPQIGLFLWFLRQRGFVWVANAPLPRHCCADPY